MIKLKKNITNVIKLLKKILFNEEIIFPIVLSNCF